MKIKEKTLIFSLLMSIFIPTYALEPIDDDEQLGSITGQDDTIMIALEDVKFEDGYAGWGDSDNEGTFNLDDISMEVDHIGSFEDPITFNIEKLDGVGDAIVIRIPEIQNMKVAVGKMSVDQGTSMGGMRANIKSIGATQINIKGHGQ